MNLSFNINDIDTIWNSSQKCKQLLKKYSLGTNRTKLTIGFYLLDSVLINIIFVYCYSNIPNKYRLTRIIDVSICGRGGADDDSAKQLQLCNGEFAKQPRH